MSIMSATPAIELIGLTKRYGSARGVEELSFAVAPGEIFGFLGPNGAGKTTAIRCLMGLLRPTRGECRVLGERVAPGRATGHEAIGYLPGDFRIWHDVAAGRALALLAAPAGGDPARARREQLAERLGLDLTRRVGDLSKGNRQKVGLILAMQHQPRLLILDEPSSGLDPLVRQTMLALVREAAAGGATVLFSSHDLPEVEAVCGRAAVLREGRLVELAPLAQFSRQAESRLRVWLAGADGVAAATPPEGVRVLHREGAYLELAWRGPADAALKWVAQWPVERIEAPQPTLEEAFVHYYSAADAPAGGKGGTR